MALNVALSGSLAMLWGMINAMQIIVHLPLLKTKMPANVKMLMEVFIQIANFKFIDLDPYIEKAVKYLGVS